MRNKVDRDYLANKHRGGDNNAKGSIYEDFYAVFRIVTCIAKYKASLDNVAFQSQLEDTFVDDLLIVHPDKKVYHQLKNTKFLTWRTVSSGRTIVSDFENQINDCRERNEQFALKLVYSSVNSRVKDSVPESIKKYASAEFFPFEEDLNGIVLISRDFQDAIRSISANGNTATVDDLVNVAMVFLGAWRGCANKNRIRLSDIVDHAKKMSHFNLNIFPDSKISKECCEILDGIEKLSYHVVGRMFYWQIGNFTGSCLWPDTKEQDIIEKKPTTWRELVAIL